MKKKINTTGTEIIIIIIINRYRKTKKKKSSYKDIKLTMLNKY